MRAGFRTIIFIWLLHLFSPPLLAQFEEDNIVVAQEWEGVYEILLRNELTPKSHTQAFLKLNVQKLNGDTVLIAGNTYELPERISEPAPKKEVKKPASFNFPIFGKKHENVPVIDNQLEGAIYFLVSGHWSLAIGEQQIVNSRATCKRCRMPNVGGRWSFVFWRG